MPLLIDIEDLSEELAAAEQALSRWKALDREALKSGLSSNRKAELDRERLSVSGTYELTANRVMSELFARRRAALEA